MQRRWEMTDAEPREMSDAELKTAGSFVNMLTQCRYRALYTRAVHSRGR